MVQILDDDDFSIKIISVDRASLPQEVINVLERAKVWEDMHMDEDIYDPYEISDIHVNRHPEINDIVTTCVQRKAQYFRLINP